MPAGNMRICMIFNPAARGGKARRLAQWLQHSGTECTLKPTARAGDGRALAAEAVQAGFTIVVAAGGDGTVNEVINGIGDVPGGYDRVCLGLLPVGTINVFAREMGLPTRMEDAWQVIQSGREIRLDLPLVEYRQGEHCVRRYFIQMAGAGLDARTIEKVAWQWKRRLGPVSYIVAGCCALFESHPDIRMTTGQSGSTGPLVLIGNGRYYGGRLPVFPDADSRDGLLDVLVFRQVNWGMVARIYWALAFGKTTQLKHIEHFQTPEFSLDATERVPLELDGEAVGVLPARFKITPRALRLLVR
jgi:YegS/Rv2252/BmrU family lipid kinase